jgi:tetratricopeptide (TPR) repeat protein
MATSDDDLRYLTFYVRFLILHNEVGAAEVWQDRLEKKFPHEIRTVTLATDIAFARERYEDILRAVNSYLSNLEGNEAARHESTRLVASLLEVNAERLRKTAIENPEKAAAAEEWAPRLLERAETLLRRNTEELPQNALAQASFYGRIGRHDEALGLLEKNWGDARPDEIIAVTSTLVKSASATKEHFTRGGQILEAALQKHSRPAKLVQALADLYNFGERFADAELLYRDILHNDPNNTGALNNLALLLALRGRGGQESLTLIRRAIEIAGPNPGLLDSRATVYLSLGDLGHAADDLAKALLRRPSAGSYFRQAQVELQLGHKDAARESFARAGELGLKAEELHPLERPYYRQLQVELKAK